MNRIKKVNIVNYKCFKGSFTLELNEGLNIIVGNNEAGKSTILEAIHLALSGLLNGRYLKNELSQYVFNKEVEREYINSLNTANPQKPPYILIEIFFSGDSLPLFEGDGNSTRRTASGFSFKIEFDDEYNGDYEELIKDGVMIIPIEFYKITLCTFAREVVSTKSIPIKSVLIDSTSTRFQNGSDVYIAKIIKDDLEVKEIVGLSQAHRKLKEIFMNDKSIEALNEKVTKNANISTKAVTVSVDLSTKNSWETSLMTYLEEIPFHQIGKGEQCLIKTNLALAHKKAKESNLILIEEPESHLSYSKLNQFIKSIQDKCGEKQIVITTHSNFVANKLGLKNLILLNNNAEFRLTELQSDTYEYFEKLPGYDTLRMLLCKKVILVEGPSDELIVQKAFMDKNNGVLPIEKEIDVITVRGLPFKRFLDITKAIKKTTAVVTDNDGNFKANVDERYIEYKNDASIRIFADDRDTKRTLELQIADANKENLSTLCEVLKIGKKRYDTEESIAEYMLNNKTACALKIFNSDKNIAFPKYINDAVEWCNE
jgi:putative ATP-dependent endonuclease of OLD family